MNLPDIYDLTRYNHADELDVDPEDPDYEPGLCGTCNGSGEGQYEGTKCHACGGKGEL
jgi:hypothetical protein